MNSRAYTFSLLAVTLVGLLVGGVSWLLDSRSIADGFWAATTLIVAIPLGASIVTALLRRQAGVDVIALLALAGAFALEEYLAGAVIAVMVAMGRALEEFAAGRAERELSALLENAPRQAQRIDGSTVVPIPVADVQVGDLLLVREADVVPVDGLVISSDAVLDESALTGESRPVSLVRGGVLRSGSTNAGPMFQMRATSTAETSTYEGIIRLVRSARASKAPLVRLADRYAAFFIPLTLAVSGAAWAATGDPVRGLAVLVVATPCPLLLAAPIAIVSGMSRAASRGIVVKGGGAIETLARARVLFVDKTGTLTTGRPTLQRIAQVAQDQAMDEAELLRLAASLDQVSSHVMAITLVHAAYERGLTLSFPADVTEFPGAGIVGSVDGHRVRLGSYTIVMEGTERSESTGSFRRRMLRDEGAVIFVSVDGRLEGAFLVDDPIRPEAARAIRGVKRYGVTQVVMVSGDHATVAEAVGAALGIDRVIPECTPEDKVEAVAASRKQHVTVMVGDGVNDAPALAAADVGVAMGARGSTSSSEAADMVLVVDRLDRLVEALSISGRSRAIAVQSITVGMGLSLVAMGFAAFGYLTPVLGALLQEGIDVVSILNALRALRGERSGIERVRVDPELLAGLRVEHQRLAPRIEQLRTVADGIEDLEPAHAVKALQGIRDLMAETVVPHERRDEMEIYPMLGTAVGGDDPLAAMSRTHQEIFHLGRKLERFVEAIGDGPIEPGDATDARRLLYALHAIVQLNIAQEEELFEVLADGRAST